VVFVSFNLACARDVSDEEDATDEPLAASSGNLPAGTGPYGAPLFLGDLESGTSSQPWLPFGTPQSHNYGNPTDTAHACFGEWYRVTAPEPVWRGKYSAKIVLDRFNGTSAMQRAETITKARTLVPGTDDYYTLAFYIPSPGLMTPGWPGSLLFEAFQISVPSDPVIGISYREVNGVPDHLALTVTAGRILSNGITTHYYSDPDRPANTVPGRVYLPGLYAVPRGKLPTNKWVELIVRVHWADESTMNGIVQSWYRIKGQSSWTASADTTTGGFPRFPTIEYSTAGAAATMIHDEMGSQYRMSMKNVPTLYYDGMGRWSKLQDALNYMH
jgi:hypothetical protein